ncbi:Uncharacterised protein [Serratia fonticola]|uniref:Uncharacterized protein n=1 Tax=Serratia fonticola TaxID=47917 RepID=A0A4V6KWN1_SERFO|nr:Uncharacterised protein [Serratia fonticola]
MKLQVQGNGASFDSTLLQTSKDGLGIELQQGEYQAGHQQLADLHLPVQA